MPGMDSHSHSQNHNHNSTCTYTYTYTSTPASTYTHTAPTNRPLTPSQSALRTPQLVRIYLGD
jgi:hypothetical protein